LSFFGELPMASCLCRLRTPIVILAGRRANITTGSSTKQPSTVPNIEPHEEESNDQLDPIPERRPKRDNLPLPRVPSRPGLSNKEDLDKIIESWRRQLPHDDDPVVFEEVKIGDQPVHWGRYFFPTERLVKFNANYDISWDGFRRWRDKMLREANVKEQAFVPMRHGILGPDLAAAHFITFRNGRVKFAGHSEWWTQEDKLPNKYKDSFLIEKIDATGLDLVWEGLDNVINLYHLEDLNLTNNKNLNVWGFDKLCRQYRFSTKLTRLNVSHCTRFCEYSLMATHRIPSLRELIITGTKAADYRFLELTVHLLKDIRPNLKVIV